MPEPVSPTIGWNVLHLFCGVTPLADATALASAVKSLEADDHQVVPVALVGHKGDVCLLALGPDLWRLRRFQTDVEAAGFTVVDSYVSLTEVSEYAQGMPEERKRPRLYPQLPPEGKPAFCFYPMSKRRGDAHNWYELPYDEREQLMLGHGATGRRYAGRVLQLITGSTGLDDYEWGVTLFGVHPDDLKACVYEMRYDEASARFAEFGAFVTGVVGTLDEVLDAVGVRD
ncbi:MAG TPA: chlorite dismutase family protein [Acidimicrobiales bacterium]|nr:chlorite dismutase family protein [Acidimicrobiales bacterium]